MSGEISKPAMMSFPRWSVVGIFLFAQACPVRSGFESPPSGYVELGQPCLVDSECDDTVDCNGREQCASTGLCVAGAEPCAHASCEESKAGIECGDCYAGYETHGDACVNINECLINNDNCDAHATCTDTDGSYTCTCNNGFLGDGVTCVPEDRWVVADAQEYNSCWSLEHSEEDGSIYLSDFSGEIGDKLLLVQMQDAFAASGDQRSITPNSPPGDAGLWQIVEVTDVQNSFNGSGVLVTADSPPLIAYQSDLLTGKAAQACLVLEHDVIEVQAGGVLSVAPWDGRSGGLLPISVSGALIVEGLITVAESGYRGGLTNDGTTPPVNTIDLDTSGGLGGGKGEGLDSRSWGLEGRGNYANGAGGGNSINAGGGGGGNRGEGGLGGSQPIYQNPLTQGMPGAAVDFPALDRLVMGGGGGSGEGNQNQNTPGGAGGGAILIWGDSIEGHGVVTADGASSLNSYQDGAGGGGAGGSILFFVNSSQFTGEVRAQGGNGGDVTFSGGADGPSGPVVDGGIDGGSDAGIDGGIDAGSDAGIDGGIDAGSDAGIIGGGGGGGGGGGYIYSSTPLSSPTLSGATLMVKGGLAGQGFESWDAEDGVAGQVEVSSDPQP